MRIAFIGGGNMSTSLAGGLRGSGIDAHAITVADPSPQQRERLARTLGVIPAEDNAAAARDADVVVLAVKPQDIAAAARATAPGLAGRRRVVVSVAAGVRLDALAEWLGPGQALVRAMPNRPALIGAGITAACAAADVTAGERALVGRVLGAVGPLVWLDEESRLDVVTAVSGSGPAYFFLLVEALEDAGVDLGLPRDTARQLAVHTAYGAGRMLVVGEDPPAVLREQVTSRGGTTAAALAVLEAADLRGTLARAVAAAARRAAELAREYGST